MLFVVKFSLTFAFSAFSPDWPTGHKDYVGRLRSNRKLTFSLFQTCLFVPIFHMISLNVVTETNRFFCEFLRPGVEQTAPARGLRISFRSFGPREGAGPAAQYIDSHAGASSDVDARVTCPPGGVSKWKRGFRAVPGRNRRDGADFLKATLNFSAVGCTWLSTCTPLAPVGPFLAPNGGWLR